MNFLMTCDVEAHSMSLNREDPRTVELVHNVGLPRLLEVLSKHDVKGTFYFTGTFSEQSPQSIDLVKEYGHEIGCHGYDHSPNRAFDLLNYEEQIHDLEKARKIIEDSAGRIEAFRAPALRINTNTVKALEKAGFKTDSSVASQRFDGPMSFGSVQKLKWLRAPRNAYMLSYESHVKKGNSGILEVPISAAIFPFIGTTMRVSPSVTKVLQKSLYMEAEKTNKPIVFLFHPNECLDVESNIVTARRTSNSIEYVFADVLRQKLKLRNMGMQSIKLLDGILESSKDFDFISVKDYRKSIKID